MINDLETEPSDVRRYGRLFSSLRLERRRAIRTLTVIFHNGNYYGRHVLDTCAAMQTLPRLESVTFEVEAKFTANGYRRDRHNLEGLLHRFAAVSG